jgi:hypothetical protein
MSKRWKGNPPGKEQKFLENLFKTGQIPPDAKPSDIKNQHKIFENFTTPVFRQHFDKTRAKYGHQRKYFIISMSAKNNMQFIISSR